MVNIIADEGLTKIQELCAGWGNLTTLPGRDICSADLRGADVLLVRSVTGITRDLLRGSSVKFIGSATIGIDHIDFEYLEDNNIAFSHAPGCNANAVVDYVMSAIFEFSSVQQMQEMVVGIAGCGNVGKRLLGCLNYFGIRCKVYDPFIQVAQAEQVDTLEELFNCDVLSLHVPLTNDGRYPTYKMIDAEKLALLKPRGLLINSSRGPVIDNKGLLAFLREQPRFTTVLDVWEREPSIDLTLLKRVNFATGHIAGYSYEGKLRGSVKIVQAAKAHFGNKAEDNLETHTNLLSVKPFNAGIEGQHSSEEALSLYQRNLRACCDLSEESRAFKRQLENLLTVNEIAAQFDAYRRHYSLRSELDYSGVL